MVHQYFKEFTSPYLSIGLKIDMMEKKGVSWPRHYGTCQLSISTLHTVQVNSQFPHRIQRNPRSRIGGEANDFSVTTVLNLEHT